MRKYGADLEQRDAEYKRKQVTRVLHQSSPFARSTDVHIGEGNGSIALRRDRRPANAHLSSFWRRRATFTSAQTLRRQRFTKSDAARYRAIVSQVLEFQHAPHHG